MTLIQQMIRDDGGIKRFSDRFKVPYRTVQDWSSGQRVPPCWLVHLFDQSELAIMKRTPIFRKPTSAQDELERLVKQRKEFINKILSKSTRKSDVELNKGLLKILDTTIINEVEKLF